MNVRRNLILFSGIVAAGFVVGFVGCVSVERGVSFVSCIPATSDVAFQTRDTTTVMPVVDKERRMERVVQRYDEYP